ncbi:unnamed protein product [Ilex paraguariensis]|uniref:Late embryogenesis abundant protein LEA-2 subgroup domain-containing protein n=1 Tax=Ilex paraguariensis TaxID=185542 RepID=A0ABC8QM98_9AQUA
MAEKDQQQQTYPPPQVNPYGRNDEELASVSAADHRRKKRTKCFIYIAALTVFQIGMILLFSLTVMKVRAPKFRIRSATFGSFDAPLTNPSFNISMIAELGVKNTNFRNYKYSNSTIDFFYKDTKVGETVIPKANAKARSTRKFNVIVGLSSANLPSNSQLGSDLGSGSLPLRSESRLRGEVELMKVLVKSKKSSRMDCTMVIDISRRELQNVVCK